MAFLTKDIEMRRGDTPELYIWVKEPISPGSSMSKPVDITGWVFKASVDPEQHPVDDTANVLSVSSPTGIEIVDAFEGLVKFNPGAAAQSIDVGNYYWDMQYTSNTGTVKTFVGGKFTVSQDISK